MYLFTGAKLQDFEANDKGYVYEQHISCDEVASQYTISHSKAFVNCTAELTSTTITSFHA